MGLRLEDISYQIKDQAIIKHMNLEVKTGEFVSLLGASGAGKSTTIKIIAGINQQSEGHVYINDELMDKVPTHKRKTSIVFQDIRLFPNMSVGENIAYTLKLNGMRKKERMERVDRLLAMVRLEGFAKRRIDELSGGQQQRVALARSIAGNPSLLLLDEALTGLDEELRDEMRLVVRALHDELKLTTIMITHDADEALMMSDRIAYLSKGELVQYDTPTNIYSRPATVDVAASFGACLVVDGEVSAGKFETKGCICEADVEDGPATAVLRFNGLHAHKSSEGALVESCSFRGERNYATIVLAGKTQGVFTSESLEPGDYVTLRADKASTFVFPARTE